ncbi:hypothetical protein [Elizabethkingia ursingii]
MAATYSKVFSGNLTADATYKKLDGEKSPISFSIAINFSDSHTEYENCELWILSVDDPKILQHLKKGTKVIVKSDSYKTSTYEKGTVKYKNVTTYISSMEIIFKDKESSKETEQDS